MRKAAGIMLIIYGAVLMYVTVGDLISDFRHIREPVFTILLLVIFFAFIVTVAFIVTGGVFCLKRKYWKLCFASALLAVFVMIYWISGMARLRPPLYSLPLPPFLAWYLSILIIIAGALPIIFVCIRKREWEELGSLRD
jgi:hypothetical protein